MQALATKVPAKYKSAQERKLYRSLIAAGANAEVAQWIMDSAQHRQVISESGVPLEMVVAQAQYAMHAPIPAELEDNQQAIALYRAFVSLGCLPEEAQKYLTDAPQEAEPVDTSTSTPAAPPIQEETPTSSTPPEEENSSESDPLHYLKKEALLREATAQERVEKQQRLQAEEERVTEELDLDAAPTSSAENKKSPLLQNGGLGIKRYLHLLFAGREMLRDVFGMPKGAYETLKDQESSHSQQYDASFYTNEMVEGLEKYINSLPAKKREQIIQKIQFADGALDNTTKILLARQVAALAIRGIGAPLATGAYAYYQISRLPPFSMCSDREGIRTELLKELMQQQEISSNQFEMIQKWMYHEEENTSAVARAAWRERYLNKEQGWSEERIAQLTNSLNDEADRIWQTRHMIVEK